MRWRTTTDTTSLWTSFGLGYINSATAVRPSNSTQSCSPLSLRLIVSHHPGHDEYTTRFWIRPKSRNGPNTKSPLSALTNRSGCRSQSTASTSRKKFSTLVFAVLSPGRSQAVTTMRHSAAESHQRMLTAFAPDAMDYNRDRLPSCWP